MSLYLHSSSKFYMEFAIPASDLGAWFRCVSFDLGHCLTRVRVVVLKSRYFIWPWVCSNCTRTYRLGKPALNLYALSFETGTTPSYITIDLIVILLSFQTIYSINCGPTRFITLFRCSSKRVRNSNSESWPKICSVCSRRAQRIGKNERAVWGVSTLPVWFIRCHQKGRKCHEHLKLTDVTVSIYLFRNRPTRTQHTKKTTEI